MIGEEDRRRPELQVRRFRETIGAILYGGYGFGLFVLVGGELEELPAPAWEYSRVEAAGVGWTETI